MYGVKYQENIIKPFHSINNHFGFSGVLFNSIINFNVMVYSRIVLQKDKNDIVIRNKKG